MRAGYGAAPLGIINSVALKGNVLNWFEMRWGGKAADKRLDPSSHSAGRPVAIPSGCRSTTCTASRGSTRAPTALAIRIGWKIETAAKILGVYAALNPGRASVVALPAPARKDQGTS